MYWLTIICKENYIKYIYKVNIYIGTLLVHNNYTIFILHIAQHLYTNT